MMVTWILSLEPGAGAPALIRGGAGELMAPKDDTLGFGVLEASYTDLGREGASPLSGKATIRVRSRRVEAEHADEISGPQQLGGAQASGKKFLGVMFACCKAYARVYVSADGTRYDARCPRCRRAISFRVGSGGTDQRVFVVE